MWLLGSGASAASGIPTASQMTLDLKRLLFCAEQRISVRACEDISSPVVQAKIQRYFDDRSGNPTLGSDEEYAHYFSLAFPDESDRRRYIDGMLKKATPSYGFLVLAVLMKLGLVRLVWTTNFDRNIEDAAALVYKSTARLTVSALDSRNVMREALSEGRSPILGKLHGDFQSRRIKNTPEELQAQDAELRAQLVEAALHQGLIVVGYSGRDCSVMDAILEGIHGGRGFPSGLFWFIRGKPIEAVQSLINRATSAGVKAQIIEIQTFDEMLADVIAQLPSLSAEDSGFLDSKKKRSTDAPFSLGRGGWPVIRLNAIEVTSYPSVCRVVSCKIGGTREVRDAVKKAGAKLLVARRKAGVLIFGSDAEVKRAFAVHELGASDLYAIEPRRFWYDSVEAGLTHEALLTALGRERLLLPEIRRGRHVLRIDSAQHELQNYKPLNDVLNPISGVVPSTRVSWAEAVATSLSYRLGGLWLVFEPFVWMSRPSPEEKAASLEFQRERQAKRYNRQWNDLLSAWCTLLTGNSHDATVSAFGISDGVDATFTLSGTTAFSWHFQSQKYE